MSIFGTPPGQGSNTSSGNSSPSSVYGRGDLQAAFNWLVNQPEHIRKQASDPDRLMTLYYRSSGRPEMIRAEFTRNETARIETARMDGGRPADHSRIETEAPVSGQNFISDLRQINEAMRQFDGAGQGTVHHQAHAQTQAHQQQPLTPQFPAAPQYQAAQPAPVPASTAQYPAPVAAQPQYPQTTAPHYPQPAPPQYQPYTNQPPTYGNVPPHVLTGKTQSILSEVREKLNLSSDAEALSILVTLGHRSLKPLLG